MQKIRIIKADETKWYCQLVGKIYCAKRIYEDDKRKVVIIRNYNTLLRTIDFDDVEFLNEHNVPKGNES